ncbi:hypothetical protein [Stella sp.]|uniref:hypothetical protein n=1 Tax=Stella sp. TaxID=2912054 RepID=UPI0035AFB0D6
MESSYQVVALAREHVLPAYILARAFRPDLSLAGWRAESARHIARPAAAGRRGALVAESEQGYLTGLALHRVDGAERSLQVDCFVVLALVDAPRIAGALLTRLEELAQASGCREVRILMPARAGAPSPPGGTTAATLAAAGYGPAGTLYSKPLG